MLIKVRLPIPFQQYDISQATIDILQTNGVADLIALAALNEQDFLDLTINLGERRKLQLICTDNTLSLLQPHNKNIRKVFKAIIRPHK